MTLRTAARAALALVATTVLGAGISLYAPPAQAAGMPSNAPRGYLSIWNGTYYAGAAYPISELWTSGCHPIPTYFNDLNVSVANNTSAPARTVRFYNKGGCDASLGSWVIYAGTYSPVLDSPRDGYKTWSSYKFV